MTPFTKLELIRIREALRLLERELRKTQLEDKRAEQLADHDFGIGKQIASIAELSEKVGKLIDGG